MCLELFFPMIPDLFCTLNKKGNIQYFVDRTRLLSISIVLRATSKFVYCGLRHDKLLVKGFSSIASSMYHANDYHYHTLTKRMFPWVYWNQPVRPCVCLSPKY